MRALLLVAVCLCSMTAHAQQLPAAEQDDGFPSWLYASATVGGGYFHFWQINGSDREAGGGVVSVHTSFAYRVSSMIGLGVGAAFTPGVGTSGNTTSRAFEVAFAPTGLVGFLFALTPEGRDSIFVLESILGIGGGGAGGTYGGMGPTLSEGFLFNVLRSGALRLTVGGRLLFGLWTWGDVGGIRPYLGATLDVGASVF